jgi:class 3 adenylate cyclase
MERIWQWAWDRYKSKFLLAFSVIGYPFLFLIYVFASFVVVALENSGRYVEAAVITAVAVVVLMCLLLLPGRRQIRLMERWAAGEEVDRGKALEGTYIWARAAIARAVGVTAVWAAGLLVAVGAVAGATGARLVQYAVLGASLGTAIQLVSIHSYVEGALRPARVAITGAAAIGDSLPRSHPTFARWSNVSVLAAVFTFTMAGAWLAAVFDRVVEMPVLSFVLAAAMTLFFAVPMTVGASFSLSLRPIRDLAEGTRRVTAGDYSQRLPVVQDDDLGALSASFNRMQAGLAERQRLQGAFGTYVDPVLATRLLEQGDDVFTGERREVTVMFVDIRDFTPFAESNSAEDTVSRLNDLFDIVVPAVVDAGGHVNKFLGDGALAVFGAPNELADHADAAVGVAVLIDRLVAERFGGELRIGIGINTGPVIAGTIGGGSKLEFTLIGDTVNVAARVEQLTKNTGDTILLTQQTIDTLAARPAGLVDREAHPLKGKSADVHVYAMDHR